MVRTWLQTLILSEIKKNDKIKKKINDINLSDKIKKKKKMTWEKWWDQNKYGKSDEIKMSDDKWWDQIQVGIETEWWDQKLHDVIKSKFKIDWSNQTNGIKTEW